MIDFLFAGVGLLVQSGAAPGSPSVSIEHQPVACAVAERFPKLEARFAPPENVARARVAFQGRNTAEWYSVDMKADGPVFVGTLPKPFFPASCSRRVSETSGVCQPFARRRSDSGRPAGALQEQAGALGAACEGLRTG